MILLDSNILMYAAGVPHVHKKPCLSLLRRIGRGEVKAALDAETLQEVLHRYRAIKRWPLGRDIFDNARRVVPTVIPITAEILDWARVLLDSYPSLAARDALHAAVCQETDLEAICSYDRDFDVITDLSRLEPDQVA